MPVVHSSLALHHLPAGWEGPLGRMPLGSVVPVVRGGVCALGIADSVTLVATAMVVMVVGVWLRGGGGGGGEGGGRGCCGVSRVEVAVVR